MFGDERRYENEFLAKAANQLAVATNQLAVATNLKQDIEFQIKSLENQLQKKKELLALLQNNPDFERMLTLLKY